MICELDSMDVWDENNIEEFELGVDEAGGVRIKRALLGYGFWKKKAQIFREKICKTLTDVFGDEGEEVLSQLERRFIPLPNNKVLRIVPAYLSEDSRHSKLYDVYVE